MPYSQTQMMDIYMKHGLLRSPTSNNPNIPNSYFAKHSKPHFHYSRHHRLHLVCGEGRSFNRTQWTNSKNSNTALLLNDSDNSSTSSPSSSSSASPKALVWEAAHRLTPTFHSIDQIIYHNQGKVQKAMQKYKIGPHHFSGSTGYGHGDLGRAALDDIVADIMGAEAAAVRIQFVSGTHAIASALFGCLRPGDELLAVAGKPYDTLEEVIGIRQGSSNDNMGSLADFGVHYRQLDLDSNGNIDWDILSSKSKALRPNTKVALIQRSCGYALRPTLTIAHIQRAVSILRSHNPNIIIAVDNCYGEFTETLEPCNVGADICMGSLIKNPGGTIVTGGGYVAGRADLVRRAVARLTAPGVGMDAGCVPGETLRLMFQGLFLAPQMVGEALKGGRLVAEVLSAEGMTVFPPPPSSSPPSSSSLSSSPPSSSPPSSSPSSSSPPSFITAIELGSADKMIAFCEAVQRCSPIGSYVLPVPGVTPGYSDEVIFADGTFIDGSTAELSADGPIRPPYVVYCQGGTHWTHWARVLEGAVGAMRET